MRSHSRRRVFRNPGAGGTQVHVAGHRLDDHARDLLADLWRMPRRTWSASLKFSVTVWFASAFGTPG